MQGNQNFNHTQKTYQKYRRHRKVKWRNVILLFIMICLVLTVASIQAFGGDSNNYEENGLGYAKVVVQSGDSLWNLIKKYNPDYVGNMEKIMWEVRCVNRISDANLQIGQVLLMPIGK